MSAARSADATTGPDGAPPAETRAELAADFARRFADYWSAPSAERLDSILAEGVRLVAPMTPTTENLDAGRPSPHCSRRSPT